jgi:hypothetical protein
MYLASPVQKPDLDQSDRLNSSRLPDIQTAETSTSILPTIRGLATISAFNGTDYQRFSNSGNTRRGLEMLAKRFVYHPTPAKAQRSRDQEINE